MNQFSYSESDAFSVEGKLALPYQYFAGTLGSEFLVSLRDRRKLLGRRCSRCKKVFVPPRSHCEHHLDAPCDEWIELPGTGTVRGFTVVRYAEPYQPCPPPYILALVALDGADSSLVHLLKGLAPSEVRVGLEVKAVYAKDPQPTILAIDHFAPAGKPRQELGYSYEELELGMTASFTKTITETDVYLFAGISGDFNPLHMNEEYAKTTAFGTRIAHGALPQSLIAPVLGMKLPGLGTLAVEVQCAFKAPTFFGDTITAKATVEEKQAEHKRVKLRCDFTNQHGQLVATGWAVVLPPRKG